MPTEGFLDEFFGSKEFLRSPPARGTDIWGYEDYEVEAESRLRTAEWRRDHLRDLFGPGPVIQIGPGGDPFLRLLSDEGWDVVACEASEQMGDIHERVVGTRLLRARFEYAGIAGATASSIAMFNVIENLPDPRLVLAECHRVLVPGGRLVINFVNMRRNVLASLQGARYFLYRPPVCFLFTAANMSRLLREAGFRVECMESDVRFLSLRHLFTLLRIRWLGRAAHYVGIRGPVRLPAYPSQLVIAQKD